MNKYRLTFSNGFEVTEAENIEAAFKRGLKIEKIYFKTLLGVTSEDRLNVSAVFKPLIGPNAGKRTAFNL